MNPIDQRHANPQATRCPVFWRRIGTPFAWFLALYPWGAIVCLIVTFVLFGVRMESFGATVYAGAFKSNPVSMAGVLSFVGLLLFPVGIVWCVVMRIAVNRGLANKGVWRVCLILGSGFLILPLWVLILMVLGWGVK